MLPIVMCFYLCYYTYFLANVANSNGNSLFVVTYIVEPMEPPVFVQKLTNKDVKEGVKARFDCTVKGKPTPEISW